MKKKKYEKTKSTHRVLVPLQTSMTYESECELHKEHFTILPFYQTCSFGQVSLSTITISLACLTYLYFNLLLLVSKNQLEILQPTYYILPVQYSSKYRLEKTAQWAHRHKKLIALNSVHTSYFH